MEWNGATWRQQLNFHKHTQIDGKTPPSGGRNKRKTRQKLDFFSTDVGWDGFDTLCVKKGFFIEKLYDFVIFEALT